TGVQTCALPIWGPEGTVLPPEDGGVRGLDDVAGLIGQDHLLRAEGERLRPQLPQLIEIGSLDLRVSARVGNLWIPDDDGRPTGGRGTHAEAEMENIRGL